MTRHASRDRRSRVRHWLTWLTGVCLALNADRNTERPTSTESTKREVASAVIAVPFTFTAGDREPAAPICSIAHSRDVSGARFRFQLWPRPRTQPLPSDATFASSWHRVAYPRGPHAPSLRSIARLVRVIDCSQAVMQKCAGFSRRLHSAQHGSCRPRIRVMFFVFDRHPCLKTHSLRVITHFLNRAHTSL